MAEEKGRSFWSSPWTCGIAGCCLGCILIPVLFVTVLGGGAFWAWRSSGASEVREEAIARATSHPAVIEALGEPIESGWLPEGRVHIGDGEGEADFSVDLTGPRGEGRLHAVARRQGGGDWEFEVLELAVEGSDEVIDLLAEPDTEVL